MVILITQENHFDQERLRKRLLPRSDHTLPETVVLYSVLSTLEINGSIYWEIKVMRKCYKLVSFHFRLAFPAHSWQKMRVMWYCGKMSL